MKSTKKIANLTALVAILALPLLLSGCGKKPAPVVQENANAPLDQTSGQSGLTPAETSGASQFDNGQQGSREIKSDADIEDILNNIGSDDNSGNIKTVDENDINQF